MLCVRCEAERNNDDVLKKVHPCTGQCGGKKRPLSKFAPVIVKHFVNQVGWTRGGERPLRCEECQYPKCEACKEQAMSDPGFEHEVLLYQPTAAHYHKGKYSCLAHKYPPCPGCGASRPRRDNGQGDYLTEKSVFKEPNWKCPACENKARQEERNQQCSQCEAVKPKDAFDKGFAHRPLEERRCLECQFPRCSKCKKSRPRSLGPTTSTREYTCEKCHETHGTAECVQCEKTKPKDQFDKDFAKKHRSEWRCLDCQFPGCSKCHKPRPRSLGPTRQTEEYTCEKCRETFKCANPKCGKVQPREAYDETHLSNHLKYGRELYCESCRTSKTEQTYYCERCKDNFPREHFHKTDLNHRERPNYKLQCRPK